MGGIAASSAAQAAGVTTDTGDAAFDTATHATEVLKRAPAVFKSNDLAQFKQFIKDVEGLGPLGKDILGNGPENLANRVNIANGLGWGSRFSADDVKPFATYYNDYKTAGGPQKVASNQVANSQQTAKRMPRPQTQMVTDGRGGVTFGTQAQADAALAKYKKERDENFKKAYQTESTKLEDGKRNLDAQFAYEASLDPGRMRQPDFSVPERASERAKQDVKNAINSGKRLTGSQKDFVTEKLTEEYQGETNKTNYTFAEWYLDRHGRTSAMSAKVTPDTIGKQDTTQLPAATQGNAPSGTPAKSDTPYTTVAYAKNNSPAPAPQNQMAAPAAGSNALLNRVDQAEKQYEKDLKEYETNRDEFNRVSKFKYTQRTGQVVPQEQAVKDASKNWDVAEKELHDFQAKKGLLTTELERHTNDFNKTAFASFKAKRELEKDPGNIDKKIRSIHLDGQHKESATRMQAIMDKTQDLLDPQNKKGSGSSKKTPDELMQGLSDREKSLTEKVQTAKNEYVSSKKTLDELKGKTVEETEKKFLASEKKQLDSYARNEALVKQLSISQAQSDVASKSSAAAPAPTPTPAAAPTPAPAKPTPAAPVLAKNEVLVKSDTAEPAQPAREQALQSGSVSNRMSDINQAIALADQAPQRDLAKEWQNQRNAAIASPLGFGQKRAVNETYAAAYLGQNPSQGLTPEIKTYAPLPGASGQERADRAVAQLNKALQNFSVAKRAIDSDMQAQIAARIEAAKHRMNLLASAHGSLGQ